MRETTIAVPQMGTDLFRKYMKSKYTQSLKRSGALPCWIELADVDNAVKQALACDGLLLPGGADIDPRLYGQKPSDKCGKPNALRDAAEPAMLRAFLAAGKPVFGICRGIQILNICLGGTLCQDIKPTQQYNHSDFLHRAHTTHPVVVEEDTLLGAITKKRQLDVNSIHHQTVERPGNGLLVSAVSADGFIEGLELPSHPFCLGVQWHPEHMSAHDKKQQALFDAFVNACQ